MTVAETLIIAFNFSAAASARTSCTKRSMTPRTIIKAMTVPPSMSPVANETADRTMSRRTKGLRIALSKRQAQPRCLLSETTFGPLSAKRLSASAPLKPSGADAMRVKTAALSSKAVSTRIGSKWIDLSSCFLASNR